MPTKNKLKLEISPEVKKIFSKAEMGTVVDDFSSQLKLVAEGFSGLNNKVDNLEGRFDNLEGKFDRLEVKVDKMGEDLENVKLDVSVIKMDIEIIKHDLKSKIGRDEFAILERRVALLESYKVNHKS